MRYRLRPEPELRVEVPPGASPGTTLNFERPDGTRIGIPVPPGKQPGEHFEVTPPALMVLVPDDAQPGDWVVFAAPAPPAAQERQWFRAKVPAELQLGRYFAARLPPQMPGGGAMSPKGSGRSGGAANAPFDDDM